VFSYNEDKCGTDKDENLKSAEVVITFKTLMIMQKIEVHRIDLITFNPRKILSDSKG
jgi:hypothetical protein